MTLLIEAGVARVEGEARVEDAEPLLAFLRDGAGDGDGAGAGGAGDVAGRRCVDLRAAGPLHAAVVGVLLALRPPLLGPAGDAFTARWLVPLLAPPPGAEDHRFATGGTSWPSPS